MATGNETHPSESAIPVRNEHRAKMPQLSPPPRLLLGPGPANCHPRVLQAMSTPQVGHLDPYFQQLMNNIQEQLRYIWQTNNPVILPISGTGSSAMEATVTNLVEPGDKVLILVNGYFSLRLADMAHRVGGEVVTETIPWGSVFTFEQIESFLKKHQPRVMGVIHAETSTGACQPLAGVGALCHSHNCLTIVDCVTSLAGVPILIDEWELDACYSGTQKCVGAPPSLGPVTFSPKAMEKILARQSPVPNWYLDIKLITSYWKNDGGASGGRAYHHTAPISSNYAIYEALRLVEEEGLEQRWQRHRDTAALFYQGLERLGLECLVEGKYRLPQLTTVKIPAGIDGAKVIVHLREKYNIEIAGGMGELAGKIWRVGLMGYNARRENVALLLAGLESALQEQRQ